MRLRQWFLMPVLFLSSCAQEKITNSSYPSVPEHRKISSEGQVAMAYPDIFFKVRETLKLDPHQARRSSKSPSEMDLISVLQNDLKLLSASKEDLLKEIHDESLVTTDLTKHLRLMPPPGEWGYADLKITANHPYFVGQKTVPAGNLVEVWRQIIGSAKKQIILNVYEFDLKIIADQLVERAKHGIDVSVGIDLKTVEAKTPNQQVYKQLVDGGIHVRLVNSVHINHQKMVAIDWEDISQAKVLFSSGNLTQSCLGPEGDLVELSAEVRPKESIPNANHVVTMRSWVLANLVRHELTKTMDSQFLYRGNQYPTTGSFQVTGPGVDPETLEAYPENSLVITFSPGGSFRNINKNLIAHFIKNSTGPIRMVQFAYSSPFVSKALLERAQKDFQESGNFDFKSVGDTPFALQDWSQFLSMSGMEAVPGKGQKTLYQEAPANSWMMGLTPDQMKKLRPRIRIAPDIYGKHSVVVNGKSYQMTSKIHHKMISAGPFAVVGTSFNFSKSAETNNEQILVFKDKNLVQFVDGVTNWLFAQSRFSVYEKALDRNQRNEKFETTSQSSMSED